MAEYIMAGIDAHEGSLVVKWSADKSPMRQVTYPNTRNGRRALCEKLKGLAGKHGAARVACAYEASYGGVGLCEFLRKAGLDCHVLAPTKIPRSPGGAKQKADPRDARDILFLLRGHLLAGNELPTVWVPDEVTRDDRELVRCREDVTKKLGRLRSQVAALLARWDATAPGDVGGRWTKGWRRWVRELCDGVLGRGTGEGLRSLLGQVEYLEGEQKRLEKLIAGLSREERYGAAVDALTRTKGVGLLTAMVFLVEMGDLSRFSNRRQVACYLGLVPSSYDSGDRERRGRITRQGSGRVRRVLCQAAWVRMRHSAESKLAYLRIVGGDKKRRKAGVVALMRRLAIRLWHAGLEAQREGPSAELAGAA